MSAAFCAGWVCCHKFADAARCRAELMSPMTLLFAMMRLIFILLLSMLAADMSGQPGCAVVVDSLTRLPLSNASVFDCRGKFVGVTRSDGGVACASEADYPVTIRYMGFCEKAVERASVDTIFMLESIPELPEVVESKKRAMLHILAYAREYSTLATYTDTVTMFREKMVDFMLPHGDKSGFNGWRRPRVLNSRSYYRFTNADGRDSVSDKCSHHFTWSDWVGVAPQMSVPYALMGAENGVKADTVSGKYSPVEIWVRNDDKISVDVNVMADTAALRWMPGISSFFRDDNTDFEQCRLRLNYNGVSGDMVGAADLSGYSFNVESRGRGHGIFQFNRSDEPFFVATYTELYVLDKEYISVKEARKWDKLKIGTLDMEIYEPADVPELQPSVMALIDRVVNLDTDGIRTAIEPDRRLVSRNVSRRNFNLGYRALSMLKQLTGITLYRSHRNFNRSWRKMTDAQKKINYRHVRDSVP